MNSPLFTAVGLSPTAIRALEPGNEVRFEGAQTICEIVAKRMPPDQIAEAPRMAREWMEKHQR